MTVIITARPSSEHCLHPAIRESFVRDMVGKYYWCIAQGGSDELVVDCVAVEKQSHRVGGETSPEAESIVQANT